MIMQELGRRRNNKSFFFFISFPNRFSCEFHITQDDGDSEDEDYSGDEFDVEDANEDTLMSVHLDTFLEKRYEYVLVCLFVYVNAFVVEVLGFLLHILAKTFPNTSTSFQIFRGTQY